MEGGDGNGRGVGRIVKIGTQVEKGDIYGEGGIRKGIEE